MGIIEWFQDEGWSYYLFKDHILCIIGVRIDFIYNGCVVKDCYFSGWIFVWSHFAENDIENVSKILFNSIYRNNNT